MCVLMSMCVGERVIIYVLCVCAHVTISVRGKKRTIVALPIIEERASLSCHCGFDQS